MKTQCLRCHRLQDEDATECTTCGGPTARLGSAPIAIPVADGPPPAGWFRSVQPIGIALVSTLVIIVLVDLIALVDDRDRLRLFDRLAAGDQAALSEVEASDRGSLEIDVLQSLLLLLASVLTLIWFYRVYVNAVRLGSLLPHQPYWAVVGWFVPFLNLVRPPRMVNQAWRASDPALVPGNAVAWSAAPRSRLVPFWWAAYLLSVVTAGRGELLSGSENLSSVRSGLRAVMVSDVLDAVAATLFAVIVWRLTARQTQRIEALRG